MDWEKFWTLFHQAWGQCHESPEYNKSVWREMQQMLQRMESDVKKIVCQSCGGSVVGSNRVCCCIGVGIVDRRKQGGRKMK